MKHHDQPFMEIRNLVKVYKTPAGGFTALKGLDVEIERGEFVAVIGKSGSGKTTFINMLTGIDRPSSGEVWIGGSPVHTFNENQMAEWRGRNLGIVFQFFQLLPTLTLRENVMLPMELSHTHASRSERSDRAMHLLELVDMVEQADKFPSAVSGGQQQRVAIARALANDPPLIVADEPTGNLDSKTAEHIFDLFEELVAQGKTILIVTHDKDQAQRVKRTIVISDGEIVNEHLVTALRSLTQDQLVEVARKVEPLVYPPGTNIVTQGETGDRLYIIVDGSADVILQEPSASEILVNRLRKGEYFGEMALLGEGLRRMTVRSSQFEETRLVALDADTFNKLVEESRALQEELGHLITDRLIQNAVQTVARLDVKELAALTKGAEIQTFPPGAPIIKQGKIGSSFFLIIQGKVDVVLEDPDGRERVINTLGKGQYFGEMALLGNRRRSATVRVAGDHPASVTELTLDDFETLLQHSEVFGDQLRRIMAERQTQLNRIQGGAGNPPS
jgi:putative ABC transport system ATP-binding protein